MPEFKSVMVAGFPLLMFATAATAAPAVQVKPIVDARLRYEDVDQGTLNADALTLRVRAGVEARAGIVSILAEGESTIAPIAKYNAFPFAIADEQRRPQYAGISDPRNLELNRLQLQLKKDANALTIGRQRINLDDQRWVGSVGWRQNEQTFDAVRGEAKLGPANVDVTYATKQRTIFGGDAGPRTAYDGHFLFAGAGGKVGPLQGKLFAYLIDYDEAFFFANSNQTYGGFLTTSVPLSHKVKLNLRASYARQSNYKSNPFRYAADYVAVEAGTTLAKFNLAAGYEKLGSDNGWAVQTPMATLHKFNGWADLFLTTPANGLQDAYVTVARKFDGVKALPGLTLAAAYHRFDSDQGRLRYGHEFDASLGFKLGKVGLLAKYANYDARDFGVDTRKVWLQAEWAF
ncbi:alginate export family protein [Sphingomonas sp. KRR8]|uniref:alginate export family protein n=1 Tax=Sphingomonas sp. KRR8 TaxID=2942996 RepID=UPI0020229A16|nr:alginate export family protein [Sphingomonas sp. KRR8]URD59799.1 alginate export family protein [Sphingomonas sp. KRR8]